MRSSNRANESRFRAFFVPTVLALIGICALRTSKHGNTPAAPLAENAPVEREVASREPPVQPPIAAASAAPGTTEQENTDDGAETARIQSYLDSIYKKSDVVSSFRTKFDEDIDCIDFYAQASVKSEMARGHHVYIPKSSVLDPRAHSNRPVPGVAESDPADDVAFDGRPDQNGNPRECTGMTVPVVRKTVAQIKAAGGLAKYLRRRRQPMAPPRPPSPPAAPVDIPGYMHVVGSYDTGVTTGGFSGDTVTGGVATSSVWSPTTTGGASFGNGHSLGQTWTSSPVGGDCNGGGSAANCPQTVEIGWMVAPDQYQDCKNGVCTPSPNPHLFIFSTQDGYWSTGCYDGEPCDSMASCQATAALGIGEPCNQWPNHLEPNPFYLYPDARYTPGQTLASSSTSSKVVERNFYTAFGTNYEPEPVQWYVAMDVGLIGGWPQDTWDGSFYDINGRLPLGMTITNGAPMAKGATLFEVGGEVASPAGAFDMSDPAADEIEMGSGLGGPTGGTGTAYFRNIELFFTNHGTASYADNAPFTGPIFATDVNCYNYGWGFNGKPQTISLTNLGYTVLQYPNAKSTTYTSPAPAGSGWGTYLYYGGLGWATGVPFSLFDPNGGTNDFCCSTKAQNGVGNDTQCAQSSD